MKKLLSFLLLIFVCIYSSQKLFACPTCIGTVDRNTPVFFSDECYHLQTTDTENDNDETDTKKSENENIEVQKEQEDEYNNKPENYWWD